MVSVRGNWASAARGKMWVLPTLLWGVCFVTGDVDCRPGPSRVQLERELDAIRELRIVSDRDSADMYAKFSKKVAEVVQQIKDEQ